MYHNQAGTTMVKDLYAAGANLQDRKTCYTNASAGQPLGRKLVPDLYRDAFQRTGSAFRLGPSLSIGIAPRSSIAAFRAYMPQPRSQG
jgi:hypothetical protein